MPMEGDFFHGVYGFDPRTNAEIRRWNLVNPALGDPLASLNQRAIIETDLLEGVEAWDYQNPYTWTASQLQTTPTLAVAGVSMDTGPSVAANAARNANLLEK